MGASHSKVKIEYLRQEDCRLFYEFIDALHQKSFPHILDKMDFLQTWIKDDVIEKLKLSTCFIWGFTEDKPGLWEISNQENVLRFEIYGNAVEFDEILDIITSISLDMGIKLYWRIDYSTWTCGENYSWWEDGQIREYYNSGLLHELQIAPELDFDSKIELVLGNHKLGKLEVSNKIHKSINKMKFQYEQNTFGYFFRSYLLNLINKQEERKIKENDQENIDIKNISRPSLGDALDALFRK